MRENVVSNWQRLLPEEDRRERHRKEHEAWLRAGREKHRTDNGPTPGHRGLAIRSKHEWDEY